MKVVVSQKRPREVNLGPIARTVALGECRWNFQRYKWRRSRRTMLLLALSRPVLQTSTTKIAYKYISPRRRRFSTICQNDYRHQSVLACLLLQHSRPLPRLHLLSEPKLQSRKPGVTYQPTLTEWNPRIPRKQIVRDSIHTSRRPARKPVRQRSRTTESLSKC